MTCVSYCAGMVFSTIFVGLERNNSLRDLPQNLVSVVRMRDKEKAPGRGRGKDPDNACVRTSVYKEGQRERERML